MACDRAVPDFAKLTTQHISDAEHRAMTTDLYAKCPCGSGKKIKFCCKDIISDIERIERMLRGEQRTAAIEKINKLLEKHPDRPALMSLKAQVHLELQNVEAATPIVDKLLQVDVEGLDPKLEHTPIIIGHIPIHHTDAINNSIELVCTKYGPIPNTNTT